MSGDGVTPKVEALRANVAKAGSLLRELEESLARLAELERKPDADEQNPTEAQAV